MIRINVADPGIGTRRAPVQNDQRYVFVRPRSGLTFWTLHKQVLAATTLWEQEVSTNRISQPSAIAQHELNAYLNSYGNWLFEKLTANRREYLAHFGDSPDAVNIHAGSLHPHIFSEYVKTQMRRELFLVNEKLEFHWLEVQLLSQRISEALKLA